MSLYRYPRTIDEHVAAIKKLPSIVWQRILLFTVAVLFAFLTILLIRRIRHLGWRRALSVTGADERAGPSAVEFYERLTTLLAERGLKRGLDQTPMEFATALGWKEVVGITKSYNRVRYGADKLAPAELRQIEEWLRGLESSVRTAPQTRSV